MPYTGLSEEEFRAAVEKLLEKRFAPSGSVAALLPFTLVRCSASGASLEVRYVPEPWARNANGTVHGGVLMTVFDSVMGTLTRGFTGDPSTPTVNLSVSFQSPAYIDSALHFFAEVTHSGAHTVHLMGRCFPENDPERIVCTAQGVFYRM